MDHEQSSRQSVSDMLRHAGYAGILFIALLALILSQVDAVSNTNEAWNKLKSAIESLLPSKRMSSKDSDGFTRPYLGVPNSTPINSPSAAAELNVITEYHIVISDVKKGGEIGDSGAFLLRRIREDPLLVDIPFISIFFRIYISYAL